MDRSEQQQKAAAFRRMHDRSSVLVLPNAWDALTARIFATEGFPAIATTSAGVAWALGYADGEQAPVAEIVAATARIVRAVAVPVSADIEGGFGATPDEVAGTVAAIIDAGAIGINLEDGTHGGTEPIRTIADQVTRIRAAREAADTARVSVVINARTDLYLLGIGDAEQRLAATIERARAYLAAGADCIYPIGLADVPSIAALVRAIDAPINLTARPGLSDLPELQRLGIARVSTATAPVRAAMAAVRRIARDLHASGRFEVLATDTTHAELQRLWGLA